MDFITFRNQFSQLYDNQEYGTAFDLACTFSSDDPGIKTIVVNWKLCAASLAGKPELVITVFQEAIDNGFFFPAAALRHDPDLAAMQDNLEYQRLVNICEERHNHAIENTKPMLLTMPPEISNSPLPLLIALHGWGQSLDDFSPHWSHLTQQGWLVAVPRSSQVAGNNVHVWDHLEQSLQEIVGHYKMLCTQYPVDRQRVVLAGFSQGGGVAVWAALTQAIPVCGVIGVGPYLNAIEMLAPTLAAQTISNMRAYLISGAEENDDGMFAKMETLFAEKEIPFQHEIIPNIGHEFPPDFEQTLKQAFAFIV